MKTTTERIKKYILKHPADDNERVAKACRSTRGTVANIRTQMRKAGELPPADPNYRRKPEKIKTGAKILVIDIETAPILAYVWSLWKQNVATCQIQSDWFCLTWAAKWLFEDAVYSGCLTPAEAKRQDDKRIMQPLWKMLNDADIVIAHNGQKFDLPRINSRFLIHGMPPPMPYQVIDTLLHTRKQFGFSSNKLDYLNQLLKLPRKMDTGGFELWRQCMDGSREALAKMLDYNVEDVRILESTYLVIRPWIKPHPNVGLFILDESAHRCPSCGSKELTEGGIYYTTVNAYAALRCNNCGATGRKRVSEIELKKRRHLLASLPK